VGSPVSRVADVLLSYTEPVVPVSTRAEEKKSLLPDVETTTELDSDEYGDVPAEDDADTLNEYVPADSEEAWHCSGPDDHEHTEFPALVTTP
jgi:hypothetical protein